MRFPFVWFLVILVISALGLEAGPARAQSIFLDPGGHTAKVRRVLFLDANTLVSLGSDKVVRLWNIGDQNAFGSIVGQAQPGIQDDLRAAALSPDHTLLAVAGATHLEPVQGSKSVPFVIRVYKLVDIKKNPPIVQQLGILPRDGVSGAHADSITDVCFSPKDSNVLASASADGTIKIWNVATGQCTQTFGRPDLSGPVLSIAFSPDGAKIAAGSRGDGKVRVWTLADTGQNGSHDTKNGPKDAGPIVSVGWSADGSTIVAAALGTLSSPHGTVLIWNASEDDPRKVVPEDQPIDRIAIDPTSHSVLVAPDDGTGTNEVYPVRVLDLKSGNQTAVCTQHTLGVQAADWSPDGSTVATGGGVSNEILIWDPASGAVSHRLAGSSGICENVRWNADGSQLRWDVLTDSSQQAHSFTYDKATAKVSPTTDSGDSTFTFGPIHAAGKLTLDCGAHDTKATVYGGGVCVPSSEPTDTIYSAGSITFTDSTTGARTIVGSLYSLNAFDSATGRVVANFIGHTGEIRSVAVSPDGKYIATGSTDETVRIWPLDNLSGNITPLVSIYAEPDGRQRWVAWTEQGYYNSTPGDSSVIRYRTDHGEDKLSDAPDATSYASLCSPAFLRKIFEGGAFKASQDLNLDLKAMADNPVPEVHIDSPATDAQVASAAIDVKITVVPKAERGLDSVTLAVNGHPISHTFTDGEKANMAAGQAYPYTFPNVALQAGTRNVITAVAFSQGGKVESDAASATVTSTMAPVAHKSKISVLAIGVSKYQFFYPPLSYPNNDATSIASAFASQVGPLFDSASKSIVLTDEKATKAAIMDGLAQLQAAQPGPDDYTVVFVAGHGGQTDDQHYFLLPYGANTNSPDTVTDTCIDWNAFYSALAGLGGHVFLFLDSCHSSGATKQVESDEVANNDAYVYSINQASTEERNGITPVITFASCEAGQVSHESNYLQHGLFTEAILEALQGKAHTEAGQVRVKDMVTFIDDEVPRLLRDPKVQPSYKEGDDDQTPYALGNFTNDVYALPLAVVGVASKSASAAPG